MEKAEPDSIFREQDEVHVALVFEFNYWKRFRTMVEAVITMGVNGVETEFENLYFWINFI